MKQFLRSPGLHRMCRNACRVIFVGFAVLAGLLVLIVLAAAIWSRTQPELLPWHQKAPRGEFSARRTTAHFVFADYLALEDHLFAQMPDYERDVADHPEISELCRYSKGYRLPRSLRTHDWNRTSELRPEGEAKGGVLLLHGLSDSPYSMRALGDLFVKQGFYVLNLRLPGHGTVPAGLLEADWRDWDRAVRIAARHVRTQSAPDKPFFIAAYSAGAALAVLYSTEVALGSDDPKPDKLFLFSPAIGISAAGRFANTHKLFSWMKVFEKSKWLDLQPEYDPFKYNSFTKNAAAQIYDLSKHVQENMLRLYESKSNADLPPMVTFQSVIDSTIVASAIVQHLYLKLPINGSHLYVFDINHEARFDGIFKRDPRVVIAKFQQRSDLNFATTVLTNDGGRSSVVINRKEPLSGEVVTEKSSYRWPPGVFSLSHVAITFPPDDPLYGSNMPSPEDGVTLHLGTMAPRGDFSIVRVSASQVMRLRYNPFFEWMKQEITAQLHQSIKKES